MSSDGLEILILPHDENRISATDAFVESKFSHARLLAPHDGEQNKIDSAFYCLEYRNMCEMTRTFV